MHHNEFLVFWKSDNLHSLSKIFRIRRSLKHRVFKSENIISKIRMFGNVTLKM